MERDGKAFEFWWSTDDKWFWRIDKQVNPKPEPNHFQHQHGLAPMATARFGNFTLSVAFGGLIPSLFNLQVHGFPDPAASFPFGFTNSFHGGHVHGYPQHTVHRQQDYYLKRLLLFIGVCVLLALIWQ